MKAPYALAAAQIKKELKRHKIPCSVTSEGYSMGSSINVNLLENPLPATVELVTVFAAKYQYGHYNSMEDIHECSNSRDDIPQAKHVFVQGDYSEEFKQLAWDHVRETMHGGEDAPALYNDSHSYQLQGEWAGNWVNKLLRGNGFEEFWRSHKARQKVEALPVPHLQLVK